MDNQKIDIKAYLNNIVQSLPSKPGVYKMKDQEGRIIYVGKAKNLRHRVASYFNSTEKMMRTQKMVEQIADIAYIVVGSELEALLLETNIIKELRPKYNILMKDDKSYVYIKINIHEPYPRIYLTRKVYKDKARYFGPKTAAHKVIKTLKILKRVFPFRNCTLAIDYTAHSEQKWEKTFSESQLEYHRTHCIGPCVLSVSSEEYHKMIDQVIDFLEGKHEEILKKVQEDLRKAAFEKKFEIAAAIRDKLKAVEEIIEPQRISDPHQKDLDIINYVEQDDKIYFNLFQLRSGKLINQENFIFKATPNNSSQYNNDLQEDPDALNAFIEQYYEKATDIPKEILIPHSIEEIDTISAWLSQMKGTKVELIVPERGKKNHLLELSLSNAQSFARQSQVKWQSHEKGSRQEALEGLQEILNLQKIPYRLECYDISHFSGTETVSSMVVFENGFPKKEDYRHFKLSQEEAGAPNDFASMEETLTRRLKYLKPSLAANAFKLRKATKKDTTWLAEKLSTKPTKQPTENKTIYIIEKETEKEKTAIGFLQAIITADKKVLIEKIFNTEPLDLPLLIKKFSAKHKVERLYFMVHPKQQNHFEENGCIQVKKIPESFSLPQDTLVLVYDCLKQNEDRSFKKKPDLMIIDGGKGQLSSAIKALEKYHLSLPMCSLAKREEEIFTPGNSASIQLEKSSPILHLIQHIRDEAHRFAVTYHQKLRLKATTSSALDEIAGIGPHFKTKLLRHFGSIDAIKQANLDELATVIGKKNALTLKTELQK